MRIFQGLLCVTGLLLVAVLVSPPVYAERIVPDEPTVSSTSGGQDGEVKRLVPTEEPGADETDRSGERPRLERLMADSEAMRQTMRRLRGRIEVLRADSAAMRRRIRELRSRLDRSGPGSGGTGSATTPSSDEDLSFEASPETRFNPNTAAGEDLRSLPGLTDRLAERIEWYRREVQPFQNRNDLRRVPGIDRRVYRKIAPYFHEGPYR